MDVWGPQRLGAELERRLPAWLRTLIRNAANALGWIALGYSALSVIRDLPFLREVAAGIVERIGSLGPAIVVLSDTAEGAVDAWRRMLAPVRGALNAVSPFLIPQEYLDLSVIALVCVPSFAYYLAQRTQHDHAKAHTLACKNALDRAILQRQASERGGEGEAPNRRILGGVLGAVLGGVIGLTLPPLLPAAVALGANIGSAIGGNSQSETPPQSDDEEMRRLRAAHEHALANEHLAGRARSRACALAIASAVFAVIASSIVGGEMLFSTDEAQAAEIERREQARCGTRRTAGDSCSCLKDMPFPIIGESRPSRDGTRNWCWVIVP
ncbi:MAG: hypothetical protein JNJ73_08030 [Hyphomonadaceae bacterium]|nr:hypothetical protein [Hyphomonadaceae bacterium]